MENQIKRPPAVWLTQIVLALYGGIPLLLLPFALVLWVAQKLDVSGPSSFFFPLGRALLLLVPFWALMKRWRYAQLLGTAAILYLLASALSFAYDLISGVPPYDVPDDAFGKIGVLYGIISWFIFFGLLIWRLLFGSAANAFFAKPTPGE